MFLISPYQFTSNASMYSTLLTLGLTTNLKLCLDAGDIESYIGSGQTWSDRSGGGYDFYRGTTSGAEGSDPTFNGTAGHNSSGEYFSVDGGDWFTLAQTNPSWVQTLHKAGAKFTWAGWFYLNNITSTSQNFAQTGDLDSSGFNGIQLGNSGSTLRAIGVAIVNGSATVVYGKHSTAIANNNAWNFLAVSVDMAAGNVNFQVNATSEANTSQTFTGTPSSASAGATLQIGASGVGFGPDVTGDRFGSVSMWDIGLTTTQLANVFNASRAKFGV